MPLARRPRSSSPPPAAGPRTGPPSVRLDPAVNPDDFLGYTVVRVGHALSQRFEALLAAHDLTPRRFAVLAHLMRDAGLGSGELARLVLITPQSMGALLDQLAAEELIERTPAMRGRRRETSLTAAGRARLQAAAPAVVAFEKGLTAGLTVAERATITRVLQTVLRTVQEVDGA